MLALVLVLAIGLNALIFWRFVQGRELASRGELAAELSVALALRVEAHAEGAGAPIAGEAIWNEVLAGGRGSTGPWFAVLVNRSLVPIASRGPWPVEAEARNHWLVEATDLRESIVARRTERAEWSSEPGAFFAPRYAVASTPISVDPLGAVGAIRVVVPLGSLWAGPSDGGTLSALGATTLLTAGVVGAFGWFLFRRRILTPVEALARGADEVAEGRYDARIPPGPANELGHVAAAFNKMARALEGHRAQGERQVAELKAINSDLQRARRDLVFAEKMATVGRLAAGVAHEVGNPLASLIGFVELLQVDRELADDLLPRMRHELDRIHRIIRDLLDYARQGRVEERPPEAVSVAAIAEAAAKLVLVQRRFVGVAVEVDLPDGAPRVRADARRLQQVLLNLLVNAAEAMEGRGRVVVRLDEAEREGELGIAVDDDGPGIPPETIGQIFEPFFTTKGTGEGTGLGLSVSLGLVREMGGSLKYLALPGGGSRFIVSLPRAEP